MISVLTCTHSGVPSELLRISLDSLLKQSLASFEVILVIDGQISLENKNVIDVFRSNAILRNIEVKTYFNEINMGHGYSRNKGVHKAGHNIIAIHDSDDVSSRTRLEKLLLFFRENNDIDILSTYVVEADILKRSFFSIKRVPLSTNEIKNYSKRRCPFNQQSLAFKKSVILLNGGYITWFHNEDYFLWIRIIFENPEIKIRNLPLRTVIANINAESFKRRGGIKYFLSEISLQMYMYVNNYINFSLFIRNIIKRLIVQLIIPNNMRMALFKFIRILK